jgi:tRNA-(ms[2]io[6]A)-hydroxylase
VLHLTSSTSPAWLERALAHLDEILVDHAHCEKKAASTAVSLLFRYPERADLALALSALAREELRHFEQVVTLLQARGVPMRHLRPSPYAGRLLSAARTHEPARLLDTLLCLALIEARSCERMQLVADAVPEPAVAQLYRQLLASEARHHHTYLDLARPLAAPAGLAARLDELARHEAAVLVEPTPLIRLHA